MMLLKRIATIVAIFSLLFVIPAVAQSQGEAVDYSDAPTSYGLASHKGTVPDPEIFPTGFVEWLGANISPDAVPPAENADTYDDGVTWTSPQVGQNFNLTFQAIFGTSFDCSEKVNVEAWIDYNRNGVFDDTEKALDWFGTIYSSTAITWCGLDPSLYPTTVTSSIAVPANAVAGNTWMRVRLWWIESPNGIEGNATPTGEILWGEVEDYPITIAPVPGPTNLLQNSSFEVDADNNGIPDGWSPSNLVTGDGRSADFAKEGSYSLKITGENTKLKSVKQRIPVSGNAGDTFTFSGWNKTEGASTTGRCILGIIYFNNVDGSRQAGYMRFARNIHDWTQLSTNFTANKNFSSIDIAIGYFYQTGAGYFDDFKLLRQ